MRKRTKRKHWPVECRVGYVIAGVQPIDPARDALLLARETDAIEAFATDTATIDHWRVIADVANLAETLAGMGVGQAEVSPHVAAVEGALRESHEQYVATKRVGTTPAGLQSMRDLAEYHRLQRTAIGVAQLERAIVLTQNRIRSAHPSLKQYINPIEENEGAAC